MYTNSRMIRLQDCLNELGRTVLSMKVICIKKLLDLRGRLKDLEE